jgi:hypothetical protein
MDADARHVDAGDGLHVVVLERDGSATPVGGASMAVPMVVGWRPP